MPWKRGNSMVKQDAREWRNSILVPIFKNKGDIQSCTNYRGIQLMSHTMKLWKRVRSVTNVTKDQLCFMSGRSTTEAIFLLRQLMENCREHKKDLHMDQLGEGL